MEDSRRALCPKDAQCPQVLLVAQEQTAGRPVPAAEWPQGVSGSQNQNEVGSGLGHRANPDWPELSHLVAMGFRFQDLGF